MLKLITILIGCSLTFAVSVRAENEDPTKKPDKSKQKRTFTPKQNIVRKTQIPGPQIKQTDPALHNNVKLHDNNPGPKQNFQTMPTVKSDKPNKFPTAEFNNKTVKKFQPHHQNFHAQPKSAVVSVQFNQNFKIHGANNWKGPHYQVFKSYHPQWHDKGWWHSHHNKVVLIGGGWYYWSGGYWYPAWGYDNSAAYYPYDGPVYSGPSATPLDQVIADVQSALKEQGYYHGDVDGLLGPMTRDALSAYQSAQGLTATAAIDEPTLDSLGLAG